MKLAIMQPYFFPYIGYFHLLSSADRFVFLDDVNYIMRGWINRNRIVINNDLNFITVPLSKASQNSLINEVMISPDDFLKWKVKTISSFRIAYSKSPYFKAGLELFENVVSEEKLTIADLAIKSITNVCDYLSIKKDFLRSSISYAENKKLKGKDRILDICTREKTSTYINAPGGKELYSPVDFKERGIDIKFVSSRMSPYQQRSEVFISGASVLDIIMNCHRDEILKMFNEYELL